MNRMIPALFLVALLPALALGQERDSTDSRNVMLNAESSSKPREISIGLPGSNAGSQIFEEGIPVGITSWQVYPYFHWSGGSAYTHNLISLTRSALRVDGLGMAIDSYTKLGGERLSGSAEAATSIFGLIRFDGSLNGPLAKKGWYFNASGRVHYDPTSVSPSSRRFVEQMQAWKLGLTRRWDRGYASLQYKLSLNRSASFGYASAPFIYNGDGSISAYKDFRLGHDCYFPENDHVSWVEPVHGEILHDRIGKMNTKLLHDLTLLGSCRLGEHWTLEGRLHLFGTANLKNCGLYETGIDPVAAGLDSDGKSITYADGTPFDGKMQVRMVQLCHVSNLDLMPEVSLRGNWRKHAPEVALGSWTQWLDFDAATFNFAHEVARNPRRLYRDGEGTWSFNLSSQYVAGRVYTHFLRFYDEFTPTPSLTLRCGARISMDGHRVKSATNAPGETANSRYDGYYACQPGARLHTWDHRHFGLTLVDGGSWRFARHWSLTGEYMYYRHKKTVAVLSLVRYPDLTVPQCHYGSGGLIFDNKWLDITAVVSYITQLGNSTYCNFSRQVGGMTETVSEFTPYTIGTLGVTMDANLRLGKLFKMHLLATWQEPKYRDFEGEAHFPSGDMPFRFTGRYISGISRFLLEIDPSFQYKKWSAMLSARYFSRQYVNKLNNAWFDGHWETFASLSFAPRKDLSLSLNFINLLNQSGASGAIEAADTIEDESQLKGLLISGTYIRPFTAELSVKYHF